MSIKRILCIFAHPDDESFGPGGFLAKVIREGTEVHLLCATKGQAGYNGTGRETSKVRSRELRRAAKILGIQMVTFLNFKDGCICNSDIGPLMKILRRKIKSFRPDVLLTFNLNGVSGHVDHMTVASAVTKVFDETKIAKKLYYFTERIEVSRLMKDYFVFFPEGATKNDADEVIDVSDVWDTKIAAIRAHKSQQKDIEAILTLFDLHSKEEYFMVRTHSK